jgi:hypothetical protein
MSVNNHIQTFEQYTKNICYEWVEIERVGIINSQSLIEMLEKLQRIHNTTQLSIRSEVTDTYYEASEIIISRLENAYEYNERNKSMYDYYVAKKKIAIEKEQKEQQLSKLLQQQQELQKQIDVLK